MPSKLASGGGSVKKRDYDISEIIGANVTGTTIVRKAALHRRKTAAASSLTTRQGGEMYLRNLSSIILVSLVLMLSLSQPKVFAQTLTTGDVTGTVYDPTRAVIPNVTVTLKNLHTGTAQTTTANGVGFYTFKLLNPGRYELLAKEAGFAEIKAQVTVSLGQTTTADLTLPISKTAETIEVSGVGPVVTQTASVNTSFSQLELEQLPSAGGDITNIAQTSPGAVVNVTGGYGNFTINGLPATSNLFTVNGENNMDPYFNINNSGASNLTLGNNEVQEATVISNPYGGEYGQLSGAQVTYITKSGSNEFHGNAQYWWNGRAVNANGWMNKNSQLLDGLSNQTPFSNANQWAGSLGGPIWKNKTFFFFNIEGTRFVLPNTIPVIVPTAAFSGAVLSNIQSVQPNEYQNYTTMFGLLRNAKGASTATPISLTAPNPGGCGDLAADTLPGFDPTTTPCAAQFTATPTALSHEWTMSARVDHNISDNDKAFFRYRMDRGLQATLLDPISSNFNATSNQPSYGAQLQWTHILGPHATNAFIAAGSHYRAIFSQDAAKVAQTFPYYVITSGTVQFGGDLGGGVYGFNQQGGYPQGRKFTQYQFIDDFAWNRGNHNLKFGANFHRYDISEQTFFWVNPGVYFGYTGTGMTKFVNGLAYQYRQADVLSNNVPIAMWYLGGYAQDEWNVRNNLKLTFALRFERNSNPVCQINCFANFKSSWYSLPSYQAGAGAGDVPYINDIAYNQHSAFPGVDRVALSPRVGFSWSPRGDNTTVVSGGFGLFYDSPPAGLISNILSNPPISATFRVRPSAGTLALDPGPNGSSAVYQASAAAFRTGFTGGQTYSQIAAALLAQGVAFPAPAFSSVAGTLHSPRWQQWNLQVQREVNRKTAITVGYNGNHGIRIPYATAWPNAYDQYGVFPGILPEAPAVPNYGTVTQYQSGAISNYHGLTVSLKRQMSQWVAGRFNYTWSHNLDEVSNGGVFTYGDSLLGQINPNGLRANNYGNSDYDIRHNVSADFVVTPKPHFANGFLARALGDWTWSGKMFWRSGLPFSVTDANWALGNGGGTLLALPLLPGATPGASSCGAANAGYSGEQPRCLAPSAFLGSAADTFVGYPNWSTQRRNQYRGPSYFNMDMSLFKNIKLTEALTFSVGAQAFNVFNHPNFANPDSALGSSNFGQITSMAATPTSPYGNFLGFDSSPRVVQVSAKLVF
jgi:Carboxypeptidase regulatory-like domain